jgi:O-antigen ligase
MADPGLHTIALPGAYSARRKTSAFAQGFGTRLFLWLALASSSIVFIEPAPYDLMVIGLACLLFCTGLSVPKSLGPAVFLLVLFLVGNLVGALASGYNGIGLRSLSIRIYMVLAWMLFACLIAYKPQVFMRTIWSGYAFAAIVAVAWGIAQFYGFLPGEFAGPAYRATGSFKDANVYGPFLVPVALAAIAYLFRARGVLVPLAICFFLLLVLGLLVAFSRGAWLNFLVSASTLSTLLIVNRSSYQRKLSFVVMLVVLGLAGFAALFWAVNYTSASEMFSEREALVQAYDVAAGGRFATQREALLTIGQTPFGIGPGMTGVLFGLEPHNIYLQVTTEAGWLGGLSMVTFLLLGLWRGVRRLREASGEIKIHLMIVLSALLGVLLQSFFIDSTHWRHLWLLLAMVWGLTGARPERVTTSH